MQHQPVLFMKKQLKLLPAAAVLAALTSPLAAAPLISIGDTVDIFFNGSVSGQYRSNVFNNPAAEDDYIFYFSPGVEVNIGRNSNANINIRFREDFLYYNRFSSQDTNLSNLYIDGTYNSGPLTSKAGFSYVQSQQNTASLVGVPGTIRNLVKRDLYNAYVAGEYEISSKTSVDAAVRWSHTDYTNNQQFANRYANTQSFSLPIDFFYKYSQKLDVGLGYRFRYTDVSSTPFRASRDYSDHFVSLALRGEIAPKLTTRLNAGLQIRDDNAAVNPQNTTTFSILSEFNYAATPKTAITAGFTRDFGVSGEGGSTEDTGGYGRVTYAFSQFISTNAHFGYTHSEYQGQPRTDKTIRTGVGATYAPNNYLAFSAIYSFINNASNVNGAGFSGHTIDLSASLRY